MKTPSVRIIGAQAISIARYGYRLVDVLKHNKESEQEKVIRLVLAQIFTALRDVGSIINIVEVVDENYVESVTAACQRYFLLFALFFPLNCNSTVWTIGYVVPFHAEEIFKGYEVGYGILSMQGKQSKHSSIKQELKTCSNRSTKQDERGKWYQLMRSSYVRNFYLPYHFPIPSMYQSHFRPRKPVTDKECCNCSRSLQSELLCQVCIESVSILDCVQKKYLTEDILFIIKPVKCKICSKRFTDACSLNKHTAKNECNQVITQLIPQAITI